MPNPDTDRLFELARQKSREGRTALADAINDLFREHADVLTDRERSLMFNILNDIVRDAEMSIRKSLSQSLAEVNYAPRDLIVMLANDEIDVAIPVLSKSSVLEDTDLIEVILHRTLEYQLAVAVRHDLSETVSDALVEKGDEGVIRALLNNPTARISEAAMSYLVAQSERIDSFQEPLLRRKDLEPSLARRMFLWVSAALRQYIMENFAIEPEALDDLLEKAVMQEMSGAPTRTPAESHRLADVLDQEGMITPELLLRSLQEGEVTLFMTLFGRRTGLRQTLVMRIIFEPGGEGLAIACKAIGLGKAFFASIFALSRKSRPSGPKSGRREIRRLIRLYDQITPESAQRVLRRWQRNADYLSAIRELDIAAKAAT